jgi:hypothetical protein
MPLSAAGKRGEMFSFLRWCLGIRVLISRERALEIAKEHCLAQAWPWVEPVHIVLVVRNYEMMTNSGMRGGNVTIRVDCSTGAVTRAAHANR